MRKVLQWSLEHHKVSLCTAVSSASTAHPRYGLVPVLSHDQVEG
jgi:hypothetical protein